MKNITLEELLEAGCHFGHQVTRQNPKAREFIFEARDGIHIIDLEKTKEGLDAAATFIKQLAQKGGTLLILGTKRQAQEILRNEQKKLKAAGSEGVYFVTQRWIGGTLTNAAEVSKNYKKLKDLTGKLQDEYEKSKYTKKEIGDWEKHRQKLSGFYGGVQDLIGVPDALLIIDTNMEQIAVKEALLSGIPTVGMTDTNADPTVITYPIPSNDDAKGSLELIIGHLVDAWIEGQQAKAKEDKVKQEEASQKEEEKTEEKIIVAKEEKPSQKAEKVVSSEKKSVLAKTKKAETPKEKVKK
jgi:small subunit ribosomal protein S2